MTKVTKKGTANSKRIKENAGANNHKSGLKPNPTLKDLAEDEELDDDMDLFEDEDMDLDSFEEDDDMEDFGGEDEDDMDDLEEDEDMSDDDDFEDFEDEEEDSLDEEDGDEDFDDMDELDEEEEDDMDDLEVDLDEALIGEPGEGEETDLDESEDYTKLINENKKYKRALKKLAESHVRLQEAYKSSKLNNYRAVKAMAVLANLPANVSKETKEKLTEKFDRCVNAKQINTLVENTVKAIKRVNTVNAKNNKETKKVSIKESVKVRGNKSQMVLRESKINGGTAPKAKRKTSPEQARIDLLSGTSKSSKMYMNDPKNKR